MYFSNNKDLVTINGLNFAIYLTARDIQNRISQIAKQIESDYKTKEPHFIIVLNGSLMVGADLLRHCNVSSTFSCVKLKSYNGMNSTGQLEISLLDTLSLKDKDVIVVEDIVDTGFTMHQFIPKLNELGVKSIKLFSLLHKPTCQKFNVNIDYLGFSIADKFVVGYGLDYDSLGRDLPHIYQLVDIIE